MSHVDSWRPSHSWIAGENTGYRREGGGVTMFAIATVRKWAERLLEATSSELLIDREPGGKTNVRLRFTGIHGICVADVSALLQVKRRGGKGEMIRSVCRFDG